MTLFNLIDAAWAYGGRIRVEFVPLILSVRSQSSGGCTLAKTELIFQISLLLLQTLTEEHGS